MSNINESRNKTITELIDSLNKSINDIREHPTQVDRIPSNFEILVRGVSDSNSLDFLFSSGLDRIIENLFKKIETGDFSDILDNKDNMQSILDAIFGKNSFKGPISKAVLNNIQASVQSRKFVEMRSHLHKSLVVVKRINLVMKNLERGKDAFKKDPEAYKKYSDAVYAIKQVVEFASRIYKNRSLINKKVFDGLNNIVNENNNTTIFLDDLGEPLY